MTCRSRLGIGCCKVSAGVIVGKHFDRCCGKGGGAALEGGNGGVDGGGNGGATLGVGCCNGGGGGGTADELDWDRVLENSASSMGSCDGGAFGRLCRG